jgi:beta-galactosidase
VAPWGVFVSTSKADAQAAELSVQTTVVDDSGASKPAIVRTEIVGPDGARLGQAESSLSSTGTENTNSIDLTNPPLWSPEHPWLCKAVTTVLVDGTAVDQVTTPFGIRALAWSATDGLTINGKTYKLSGGCIHDDNGVLGACAFDRAEERKIELLKAAGFNAIRTAHNPPSPALLDACDRLGMLVLDEAFDCWAGGKNKCDYSVVFKDWWARDIDSMIERDRNHPAVIMWSIGNEIPGIYTAMGAEYGPQLAARIHSLDRTRPVTNGILGWPVDANHPRPTDAQSQANADANWNSLDIVGSNYALGRHIVQHAQFPNRILVSTESSPPIGQASQVLDNPYVVGDFVWSAQDYLGEAGVGRWFYAGDPSEPLNPARPGDPPGKINPVMHGNDKLFPWHGANSGDVDLLGNIKPAGHLRNIAWNMGEKLAMAVRQPEGDKRIIVVGWGWFPTWESWTWPGWEGKPMQVEVYSSYPEVRLYLNGKSLGDQKIQDCRTTYTVTYQPGTLKAVGLDHGQEAGDVEFETAGGPAAIRLTPDRTTINADGQDLSFVKVEVVDAQGRLNPNADQQIDFDLAGPAAIAGLGNADLKSQDPYQGTSCHAFHGRALLVIRAGDKAGPVNLTAHAAGLKEAAVTVQTAATNQGQSGVPKHDSLNLRDVD